LPGCVTTGASVNEVVRNIRDAIEFHREGLREHGLTIPKLSTFVEYCELVA
jgi:predicted RNase H-like HicB family nuclease